MRWSLLLSLSAAVTLAAGKVSTNARCGNAYNALPGGMTCKGSKWGDCCSQYGYCGKTKDYCGAGCQSSFGTCNGVVAPARTSTTSSRSSTSISTRTASSTAPSATDAKVKVTTNARCGNSYGASPAGMTCSGGKYGDCCSQYSYCGSGSAYCGTGCQVGFGKCDAVVSSASSSRSSSFSSGSSSASSSTPILLSTSSSASSFSTDPSSSTSISSTATSSSSTLLSTSTSESSTSTASSSSSTDEASTLPSSSSSSEISVTPETATSMTSPTPSPSSSTVDLCGVEGTNTIGIRVLKNTPFTTIEDCLAQCIAESKCISFIKFSSACILAEVPFTAALVTPKPGTGLIYYNRDCVTSALAATAPPTTLSTSTSTTTTTPTPSPSPSTAQFCGTKGYIKDSLALSTFTSIPFTTTEDCLASCRAESRCGSIMFFNDGCYLNEAPITTANVDLGSGAALTFYNRDCGISAPATTAPPTTLATSTTSATLSPSPSPSPAEFCALEGVDRINLQIITSSRFTTVDDCLAKCRANSECGSIMVRNSESCSLTIIPIDSTNVSPRPGSILRYWNRDCGVSASVKPGKRGEEEKKDGSEKSVSIAKWTQGKQGRQRGPKDT